MVTGTPSKHCVNDRMARLQFIAEKIGFGKEVAEIYDPAREAWRSLTDTGIIFVRSADHSTIVTAYVATKRKAMEICGELPNEILQVIRRNIKLGYDVLQNKGV